MMKMSSLTALMALGMISGSGCATQQRPSPVPLESQPLQSQLNLPLKHELDSILVVDQYYRELLGRADTPEGQQALAKELNKPVGEAFNYLIQRMLETDSSNIKRVSQLIGQHGYPGKSLVGEPTNEAVFYVVQHSNRIVRYLPLLRQAAEKGELPFSKYAMMLDRQLMQQGKEQMYGTQGSVFGMIDPATGKTVQQKLIWPIQEPATVNERRRQAGFTQTVEENAQRLGIPYQVYTLEQVRQMERAPIEH